MDNPKISIIILNWNGISDTRECLESLERNTYKNIKTYLVDNGSKLDEAKIIKDEFSWIVPIRLNKNFGFAEGNNIGMRRALADENQYCLLLNNDTTIDPYAVENMIKLAESENSIGIVGPKVYYYDRPRVFQTTGNYIDKKTGRISSPSEGMRDTGQFDNIRYPDYITGAALLIKSTVIKKIGLLDSAFFAYWEDADWCVRATEAGFKNAYCPEAKIWHKHSASSRSRKTFPIYLTTRNRYYFFRKHPQYGPGLIRLIWEDTKTLTAIRTFFAIVKGVFHGLTKRLRAN